MELSAKTIPFIIALLFIGFAIGFAIRSVIGHWDECKPRAAVMLTLFQLKEVRAFAGEDDDDLCLCLKEYGDSRVINDEIFPRGLYVHLSDHPDEGMMYLPPNAEDAEEYSEYQEELEAARHYKRTSCKQTRPTSPEPLT